MKGYVLQNLSQVCPYCLYECERPEDAECPADKIVTTDAEEWVRLKRSAAEGCNFKGEELSMAGWQKRYKFVKEKTDERP